MTRSSAQFSVAEALQLDVLRSAKVVAGAGGLARPIHWVHIVEIPDIPHWVKGGELLLTDAKALVSDLRRHPDLIERLEGLGIAGVVFSVMGEVQALPESLLQAAERVQLPVIEVPYEFHYVAVTEVILRRLVDHQGTLIRQAMTTHLRLTQLVLAGGDLTDLARALAELVQSAAVRIEDEAGRRLALAGRNSRNEPSHDWAEAGLGTLTLQSTLPDGLRPQRFTLASNASGIAAPIVVGSETLGHLLVLESGRAFDEVDQQTVESAATVAALILLRQRAIADTEARFRGDVLAQMVEGTIDDHAATQQALARFGLRAEHDHQVLVLELAHGTLTHEAGLLMQLERTLGDSGLRTLHGMLGRRWVAVLDFRRDAGSGSQLAAQLCQLAPTLRAGLGEVGPGWDWVHTSYRQALDAATIVGRLPNLGRSYASFAELGYLHWLLTLSEAERHANPYTRKIEALLSYDGRRGGELLATLEAYLGEGGNGQRTARRLHIHRSTLNYRLERIAAVCGVELSDPIARLNLHLALKAHQLAAR